MPSTSLCRFRSSLFLSAALLGLLHLAPAHAQTVTSTAEVPAPGQLLLEVDGVRERSGPERVTLVPYEFKLGITKDWGAYLGGDSYVSLRDGTGNTTRGGGDTTVGVRRIWQLDDDSANGIHVEARLPTAARGLGTEKTDYSLIGLVTRRYGRLSMDLNAYGTRFGATDPAISRNRYGAAAAFGLLVAKRLTLIAEVSGRHQRGIEGGRQLLYELEYAPVENVTIEAGASRADRPHPGNTTYFLALTVPIAKLW
jgi:hypothetical protein